ncbi:hypothetical protein SAMD00019534_097510 [Acytostelium subglobosum LB1]|uniref:hypothetical protein n=1 Tax=Acytostelium subglobosum LB1 TaxID=1410327 RepID=UPI000644E79D|nr:hypothetical protein SAMD00019534_097510 [Acytostelium subglobosum LB1]GAM26576.1 hypothetical protein SAMD00019534_097510 [Acytostelium subglobosum LB1]|eukprot:XP_012750672.1 hypothetical protein SAMD00019534_097510 [Acytostelium subglobosum LB1]
MAVSVAAYYTGCAVGQKAFTRMSERSQDHWSHVCIAAGLCLLGDLLYASYPKQIVIVTGRFIAGVGSGNMVGLQCILVQNNDKATRMSRLAWISNSVSLAHIVGPALIALLSNFQMDKTFNVSEDYGTISFYGWMAAFFSLASLILGIAGKSLDRNKGPNLDRPISNNENEMYPSESPVSTGQYRNYFKQQSCILSPRITLYALCFVHFLLYNIGMIMETMFIPYIIDTGGYSAYNWTLTQISLFFIGVGVASAVSSYFSRRVDNRYLLLVGSLATVFIGFALMTTWTFVKYETVPESPSPNIVRFMLGVILVCIGFPVSVSSSISLFFEIMSTVHIQNASSIFIMASSFGRLLGPLWATLIFDKIGPNYDFFFGAAVSIGTLIILLSLGRSVTDLTVRSGNSSYSNSQKETLMMDAIMEEGEVHLHEDV